MLSSVITFVFKFQFQALRPSSEFNEIGFLSTELMHRSGRGNLFLANRKLSLAPNSCDLNKEISLVEGHVTKKIYPEGNHNLFHAYPEECITEIIAFLKPKQ